MDAAHRSMQARDGRKGMWDAGYEMRVTRDKRERRDG